MDWLLELKARNASLFQFGLFNFGLAMLFLGLSHWTHIEVGGTNAWFKPIKFALSIGIYSWTIAWYLDYLPESELRFSQIISWIIILCLGFEIIYIGWQAGRGQLSHFNLSSPLYGALYALMAIAATAVSVITLLVALKFFQFPIQQIPPHYLWSIRLGLILFFVFSLEGFVMGSRLSHTIGATDGGRVLPFLNWSRQHGDPRVAHFIGMHALQVLPFCSYYLIRNTKLTFLLATLYGLLSIYVLIQALYGKPFIN